MPFLRSVQGVRAHSGMPGLIVLLAQQSPVFERRMGGRRVDKFSSGFFLVLARPDLLKFFHDAVDRVLNLVIGLQPNGVARLPLTQRAFRSPAGARVTFLLLA